jgi:hypothetical protein
MAPSLLPGVDFDDLVDQNDCILRVLAETVVPRSVDELEQIMRDYTKSGMLTLLPSPKKRRHCDYCEIAAIVDEATTAGWLHKISGKSTYAQIAEHTDGLKSTLSHDFPTEDGGRHNRVLDWADTKQTQLDKGERGVGLDATVDHYALTHAGFEQLTGHKQGERPVHDPEDVDPADISPATIGDA